MQSSIKMCENKVHPIFGESSHCIALSHVKQSLKYQEHPSEISHSYKLTKEHALGKYSV